MRKHTHLQFGNQNAEKTIVYLHGSTMSERAMTHFAPDGDFNNIFIAMPGHSQNTSEPLKTIDSMADYVVKLLIDLKDADLVSDDITLVGYSMGGCIASEVINTGKLDITRLVMLSSGTELKGCCPLLEAVEQMNPDEFDMNALFSNGFGSESNDEDIELATRILSDGISSKEVGLLDLLACNNYAISSHDKLSLPILVIAGDEDTVVPLDVSLSLCSKTPNSQLVILNGKGHAGVIELHKEVRQLIGEFCS